MKSSSDRRSVAHPPGTGGPRPRGANANSDRRAGSRIIGKEGGLVAGVDIGATNLRVALSDLQGKVLGRWKTSTEKTSSPDMVIARIEEGINYLLQQSSVSHGSLVAVAAGAPGITDPNNGVVLATSYLKGWRDVPLSRLLEVKLGVPAAIENDVRMAALGEHWMGAARGADDFVFLAIGTGIAAGVFANGKLIHGTHCSAGEVGYMHVPHTPEGPAKPGAPGSLESVIGGDGIREQWSNACGDENPQNVTATEIYARANNGDPLAKRVLDHSAQVLAYAIYNISLVLDSALFVLGGGIGVSAPLCDATNRILECYNDPARPQVVISRLGTDAQLMGAIRLALTTAEQSVKIRA
jgi:glucokinase